MSTSNSSQTIDSRQTAKTTGSADIPVRKSESGTSGRFQSSSKAKNKCSDPSVRPGRLIQGETVNMSVDYDEPASFPNADG